MSEIKRLNEALKAAFLKIGIYKKGDMAKYLGYKGPYFSGIINGKEKLTDQFLKTISDKLQINTSWILSGTGEMLKVKDRDFAVPGVERVEKKEFYIPGYTKDVREVEPKEYATHIEVKLVTTKARAGFAGAYYADEYLDEMPTVLIDADRDYKGKYLAFEVDGDSMEPEYLKGDVVICREVKRDLWQYKLHYNDWDFVIAHGTKGIMLKEIIDHNVETGDIICHSLNQEGGSNPDFTLNLREVAYLYNIVEHRRPGRSKRRNR